MARYTPAAHPFGLVPTRLERLGLVDRRLDLAVALAVALGSGLLTSAIAPRGPSTTAQALLVMAIGLAIGAVGGALTRSRWILVPAAVAYIAGAELGRIDVVAPTLALRLDNAYGIVALVVTRGIHGLLVFLPLAVGVVAGIAIARRIGWMPRPAGSRLPFGSGLLGLATVGLAVLVAWPASTPPVLGADGRPVAGSIAELATVRLGGTDQTVMIRAADPTKPVLLYLSGGPGQSDLAFSRVFAAGWTADFVVVDLDQRGNGTSYPAIDPTSALTLDRAVADVDRADRLPADPVRRVRRST